MNPDPEKLQHVVDIREKKIKIKGSIFFLSSLFAASGCVDFVIEYVGAIIGGDVWL